MAYVIQWRKSKMWQEVVSLFVGMEAIPAVLLCVGIVFCIVEMFIPGVGFFGISGSILIIAGIVIRFIRGFSLTQLLILVFIIAVILTMAGLAIVHSAKVGLLSHSPIVNNKTAIPVNFVNEDLNSLVGSFGFTITECRPIGKAKFGDRVYEVITDNQLLPEDTNIKVVRIEGNNIVVKGVLEGEMEND